MRSLGMVRDERAAPLFAYIINHVDHRGSLGFVYLKAIEIARHAERSGRHSGAEKRAVPRRVVGAAPIGGAAPGGGRRARAHRHA